MSLDIFHLLLGLAILNYCAQASADGTGERREHLKECLRRKGSLTVERRRDTFDVARRVLDLFVPWLIAVLTANGGSDD
jgi:hypothetical protein